MKNYSRLNGGLAAGLIVLATLSNASARAELQFAQPFAEAGEVKTGATLSHRFAFVNSGSEVVEIIEARVSCGCLTPELAQRRFQAGEKGELILTVNTLSQAAGAHAWPVHVSYRIGTAPHETTVQLTGRVINEITVQPSSLTMFAETAISHEITVTDARPKPFAIVDVRSSSDRLQARPPDASTAGGWNIRVAIAPDCPEGRHTEALTIYTDDPLYRELRVPMTIVKRARQRVVVLPQRVTLLAPPGQPVPSCILLVSAPDEQPVIIDKVTADHPAISYRWAAGPGPRATVKISVERREVEVDTFQSAVHIHVSRPCQETVTVPVSCILK
jgi:hypothetical protein